MDGAWRPASSHSDEDALVQPVEISGDDVDLGRGWPFDSFRRHPDSAIDANRLTVHVVIVDKFEHHRRQFGGSSESFRVQHIRDQVRLELVRSLPFTVYRSVNESWGDGVDSYADRGKIPGYGQGHADYAAF